MVSGLSFCGPWLGSALLSSSSQLPHGGHKMLVPFPISPRGQASSSVACENVPGLPAHWGDLSLQHHSLHTECDAWALVFLEHTASHQGLDILSLCPGQPPGPLIPLGAAPSSQHLGRPSSLNSHPPTPGPSNPLPTLFFFFLVTDFITALNNLIQ